MRYRPFARTGMAVSALSLGLNGADDDRKPAAWRELLHAAFEEGVNAFEIIRPSPALLAGVAEGVAAVKRSLLFVSLRINAEIDEIDLAEWVEEVIAAAQVGELNLLNADAGAANSAGAQAAMRVLKHERRVNRLGVVGDGNLLEAHIEAGDFDSVVAPFSLLSAWRERHLIRRALERQLGVIACNPFPPEVDQLLEAAQAKAKPGWFKRAPPLAGAGSYTFLKTTPGWTAEQICLAYALTEPALATVQVEVDNRRHLAQLASVADREMPSAVSAQIEMARFSAGDDSARRSA
jgi:aryl-alcohol dehydrogenase-like predicted oxidoreductase